MQHTTSRTVGDYQDVNITGNTNNINNALKDVSEIVLCKNLSSNCCTYDPDCKFQHRNNIERKKNQQPNGYIYFNITYKTSNAEIKKLINLHTNQTIRQQRHAAKTIELANYRNTKSKSTNINYTSINNRVFTSVASCSKPAIRSK